MKAFIELRDVKCGSTYTLSYDPANAQLKGVYFQAVEKQHWGWVCADEVRAHTVGQSIPSLLIACIGEHPWSVVCIDRRARR